MKLEYKNNGNIGEITLTNPPYNKLTTPVFEDIDILKEFIDNKQFKAIIIKGKGRNFCAGADLNKIKEQSENKDDFKDLLTKGKELLLLITNASVPVIAMINGSCLGAGLEIALACHFRICSENAMLGFMESTYGLMPGFGGTVLSTHLTNRQNLISLILSGKLINGVEATKIGLCSYTYPKKGLEEGTHKFIDRLTQNRSHKLIRAIMTSINNGHRLSKKEALDEETSLFLECVSDAYPTD